MIKFIVRFTEKTGDDVIETLKKGFDNFTEKLKTIPKIEVEVHPDVKSQHLAWHLTCEEDDARMIFDVVENWVCLECGIREPYKYLEYESLDYEVQVQLNKYMLDFPRRANQKYGMNIPEDVFPVKYSPEMKSYINELRQVTESLYEVGVLERFFTKSLLVSMDDGWGYSAFLRAIAQELAVYYRVDKDEKMHSEISFEKDDFSEWEKQADVVKKVSSQIVYKNWFAVMAYDLSDWTGKLSDPRFLNYLRKMGQYSKNILLVFRVPHMDVKSIRNIEREIANALSIRSLVIPPVANEDMIQYFKAELLESDFVLTDGCDDLLEQWICQEKNEGTFYGYKTLDKMAGELIYHKALCGPLKVEEDRCVKIVPEDIKMMLNDEFLDDNPYDVLNELIGMAQVKTKIREIVAQIKMQKALEEQGKKVDKPSMHMLFLGAPGTGKTTVARLVGQIFKQEGILKKGHFIEKTGNEFIVRYVGETVQKARAVFRDAYGSVLFVDEAYGMVVGTSSGSTADELVPIFVAEMENHREDLCVIFAGYKDEMKEFLKTNSGLESRFPHIVEFPNYSKEELIEIFFKLVNGKFEYEEELKEAVIEYIQNLPEETFASKEFSNARFIRNLYEHLWGKAAYRISLSGEKEICLKKADMVSVMEEEDVKDIVSEKNKKTIGFRIN